LQIKSARIRTVVRDAVGSNAIIAGTAIVFALGCHGPVQKSDRPLCTSVSQTQRAEKISEGIVGIVVYQSDALAGTDRDDYCSREEAELSIWKTPEPVERFEDAAQLVATTPPSKRIQANFRYEQALEPGNYLACYEKHCVAIDIQPQQATTVNLKTTFGDPRFFVIGHLRSREDQRSQVFKFRVDGGNLVLVE